MHPLSMMIEEVERELRMRSQVYPGLVARKRMRQSEAIEHTERMKSVLATLQQLQDGPGGLSRKGNGNDT